MKPKIKKRFVLLLAFALLLAAFLSYESSMRPFLYAQMEAMAMQELNTEISQTIQSVKMPSDLFIHQEKSKKLDVIKINQVLSESLQLLNEKVVNQKHTAGIPIGNFTHINFLQHRGFEIPVELRMFEKASGKLSFQSESLGINNVLVTIFLDIVIEGEAYLGFYQNPFVYHQQIPLAVELFLGEVPDFFPYK